MGGKILVVDDEPEMLSMVTGFLKDNGYEISEAGDGEAVGDASAVADEQARRDRSAVQSRSKSSPSALS